VDPELVPVRPPGRLGIDRGFMVALAMVALIALGLIKPWQASTAPTATRQQAPALAAQSPTAAPTATPQTTAAPALDSETAVLLDLRDRLVTLPPADEGTTWLSSSIPRDILRAPLLTARPEPAEIGPYCAGGALVGEGSEAIGVTLRGREPITFAMDRLFEGQPPVAVPITATVERNGRIAIIAAEGESWPPGYYALTLESETETRVLPLCVGRLLRAVDYSLIVFVPNHVDDPAAREAFVAEIGND
jgi:hypothetical protein